MGKPGNVRETENTWGKFYKRKTGTKLFGGVRLVNDVGNIWDKSLVNLRKTSIKSGNLRENQPNLENDKTWENQEILGKTFQKLKLWDKILCGGLARSTILDKPGTSRW